MEKHLLHDFDGVKDMFGDWWTMLKGHHAQLKSAGYTDEAWNNVIDDVGRWHMSYAVPFSVRMGSIEIDILTWLRDNDA